MDTLPLVVELAALKHWTTTRWLFAAGMTIVSALAIGVPTDVIPNPVFGRQGTPVEPWAVPVLVATAILSGLLFATYVRPDATLDTDETEGLDRSGRFGGLGGLLSFFAIGCPICNKVVVIALGTSGALTWFAPIQPYLGIIALGLLLWALRVRLRGEVACSIARSRAEFWTPPRPGGPVSLARWRGALPAWPDGPTDVSDDRGQRRRVAGVGHERRWCCGAGVVAPRFPGTGLLVALPDPGARGGRLRGLGAGPAGYGRSSKPPRVSDYAIDRLLDDIAALIDLSGARTSR